MNTVYPGTVSLVEHGLSQVSVKQKIVAVPAHALTIVLGRLFLIEYPEHYDEQFLHLK